MSNTHELISDLVRAANSLDCFSQVEVRRLLGRAVGSIRDMREQIDFPNIGTPKDAVISLQTSAIAIGLSTRTDAQITAGLLAAAGMIRDLRILLESSQREHNV